MTLLQDSARSIRLALSPPNSIHVGVGRCFSLPMNCKYPPADPSNHAHLLSRQTPRTSIGWMRQLGDIVFWSERTMSVIQAYKVLSTMCLNMPVVYNYKKPLSHDHQSLVRPIVVTQLSKETRVCFAAKRQSSKPMVPFLVTHCGLLDTVCTTMAGALGAFFH